MHLHIVFVRRAMISAVARSSFCLKRGHALEFSELVRQQHKPFAARMGA